MGDIIDISLSKGKPIQILPHTNSAINVTKSIIL